MRITSIAATIAALFLPSRSAHISVGKLALIGMLFTTFFLFTSAYNFPGGASHYPAWAEAIVNGTTLPASFAQREVGFSLLYILGGFTFTHSFIGLTLILAMFAVMMGVLVYMAIEAVSPTIAFYSGLACILTLSPFTYLKFFYPDEAYIFFNLLAVTLLIRFIQSKGDYRILYFFTLVSIAASFTRTAGNLMYPVLLTIAYITVRGNLRHYITCVLMFALAAGLYQWHRYEVFDMRHQASVPSGKGMQIFYANYLYLGDFGERLTPDIGPNTKILLEKLREQLGSNVRDSALIKNALSETPSEFMEQNLYAYTPEQLMEKITKEPNEEYFNLLLGIDSNDQFILDVAKEIMRAHPWYVVQYSLRNLKHALFDPGYATTRYNTMGYIHTGNDYVPAVLGWGTRSEDPVTQYGSRAENEMKYFPLESAPKFIQEWFRDLQLFYIIYFDQYVSITSLFMIIAWIGAGLGIISLIFPHKKFFQAIKNMGIDKMTGPILVVSAWVLYEDLLTSLFCQPVYRYFHMTEPVRMIIAGFGVAVAASIASLMVSRIGVNPGQPIQGVVSAIQKRDLLDGYFAERRTQWIILLIGLNVVLFGWWVASMLAHT